MKLGQSEKLVSVDLANDDHDILLSSSWQKYSLFCICSQFFNRSSTGVRGISLKPNDRVVAMNVLRSNTYPADMIDLTQ